MCWQNRETEQAHRFEDWCQCATPRPGSVRPNKAKFSGQKTLNPLSFYCIFVAFQFWGVGEGKTFAQVSKIPRKFLGCTLLREKSAQIGRKSFPLQWIYTQTRHPQGAWEAWKSGFYPPWIYWGSWLILEIIFGQKHVIHILSSKVGNQTRTKIGLPSNSGCSLELIRILSHVKDC